MTNGKRSAHLVAEADRASVAVLDRIRDKRELHRTNAERVIALCREFVTARPVQEPSAARIAEVGIIRYPRFPKKQSLLNQYAEYLKIWRTAFNEIVSVNAPRSQGRKDIFAIDESSVAEIDPGTSADAQYLKSLLLEQVRENNRLRKIIRLGSESRAASVKDTSAPAIDMRPLARWLNGVGSSNRYLNIDDLGVRISHAGRANALIMDTEVLGVLRTLIGGDGPSQ